MKTLMFDFQVNAQLIRLRLLDAYYSFFVFLRWGGGKDDKYFARLGKNVISVYETETFSLLDKKSLKVENVVDFSWSPTDPIISLFVPELGGGNQPARVSINCCRYFI